MEIRQFSERVLLSDSLPGKLVPLNCKMTDELPGEPIRVEVPARPKNLRFAPRRTAPTMPSPLAFQDPAKRAVAHHIMANHELQALEVMAFMLCAFPDAPSEFRRGMIGIMHDEQRHTRMHVERALALGLGFGNLPVNCYIWKKSQAFRSPLDYLAGLPLTFEGCNLDYTLEFTEHFRRAGDERSAALMRTIHRDEIEHVAFGLRWLRKLKSPQQSDWTAYTSHLHWPLRPSKARGKSFYRQPRRAAGMSDEFIDRLEQCEENDSQLT